MWNYYINALLSQCYLNALLQGGQCIPTMTTRQQKTSNSLLHTRSISLESTPDSMWLLHFFCMLILHTSQTNHILKQVTIFVLPYVLVSITGQYVVFLTLHWRKWQTMTNNMKDSHPSLRTVTLQSISLPWSPSPPPSASPPHTPVFQPTLTT